FFRYSIPPAVAGGYRTAAATRLGTLPAPRFEVAHETDQGIDSRFGKSVIYGRTHPANQAMSLQTIEACSSRICIKCLLQLFRRQSECDVHQRAAVLPRGSAIEPGSIDFGIEFCRLSFFDRLDSRKAALRAKPL